MKVYQETQPGNFLKFIMYLVWSLVIKTNGKIIEYSSIGKNEKSELRQDSKSNIRSCKSRLTTNKINQVRKGMDEMQMNFTKIGLYE